MRVPIGCLIAASLAACAFQPTQPARQQPPQPTPLQTMLATCDLSTNQTLQLLDGKFPLSLQQIQQPPLSVLSTDRGPTPAERTVLSLYDQLHHSCVKAQADWLLAGTFGMMPEAMGLQQKMFASEQGHLVALYNGRETFAQFAQEDNALHVGFMNEVSRMAQSTYDKTQQQMRSSAPVQTNCQTYYDGSVKCTTQQ